MKQTIILKTPEDVKKATAVFAHLKLDVPMEVIIREHKKDRSAAQSRLYWLWLTLIANELGYIKEELHEEYKRKYLIGIFIRDDEDFAKMITTIKGLSNDEWLRKQVVALVSTTRANVQQFTEYLQAIEMAAADMGIVLPHPDDYYFEAMGVKR